MIAAAVHHGHPRWVAVILIVDFLTVIQLHWIILLAIKCRQCVEGGDGVNRIASGARVKKR